MASCVSVLPWCSSANIQITPFPTKEEAGERKEEEEKRAHYDQTHSLRDSWFRRVSGPPLTFLTHPVS